MLGFIHPSERYAEPRLGQVLEARVIGFREVDRTLNLSLKPRSFEMLENDAQMILTYLESNGGFMTLNDKSSPADIKATFGISKGQFKKALGGTGTSCLLVFSKGQFKKALWSDEAKNFKQDQFGTELTFRSVGEGKNLSKSLGSDQLVIPNPMNQIATFGISKGQFKKGWSDEGQKNQTRSVWNRINRLGEGMRKSTLADGPA